MLSYLSLFLFSTLFSVPCAAAPLDAQPHDVMLSIAMPGARNARRLLNSNGVAGGQTAVQSCPRDTVASGRAPLVWFYAGAPGGMPQHGLPKASLVTTGFADRPYVDQWHGACSSRVVLCASNFVVFKMLTAKHVQVALAGRWRRQHKTRKLRA
jgi:hypothetical protein